MKMAFLDSEGGTLLEGVAYWCKCVPGDGIKVSEARARPRVAVFFCCLRVQK